MTLYVKQLEEALTSLLNDEDVKTLPCYKLLSNKYGSIMKPTQKMVKCECGMLFKSDTHFTSEKHLAWIKAKSFPSEEDKNPNLLKSPNPPEDKNPNPPEDKNPNPPEDKSPNPPEDKNPNPPEDKNPNPPEDKNPNPPEDKNPNPPEDKNPNPNKPVYQVEIKGIIYLNKDDVLYDSTSYKKVGSIGKSGFIIGTKVIPIKTKKKLHLHPDLDNKKWIDDEQMVYSKVNEHVAHAIGLFEKDELQLWD